jgi:hypothetical protein
MSGSNAPWHGQAPVGVLRNPAGRLPDEGSITEEADRLFEDSDTWLSTEHPSLGGKRPRDCIGSADEQAVRDLLRTIRHIGIS